MKKDTLLTLLLTTTISIIANQRPIDEQLAKAAANGNTEKLMELIRKNANPYATTTVIHTATTTEGNSVSVTVTGNALQHAQSGIPEGMYTNPKLKSELARDGLKEFNKAKVAAIKNILTPKSRL